MESGWTYEAFLPVSIVNASFEVFHSTLSMSNASDPFTFVALSRRIDENSIVVAFTILPVAIIE